MIQNIYGKTKICKIVSTTHLLLCDFFTECILTMVAIGLWGARCSLSDVCNLYVKNSSFLTCDVWIHIDERVYTVNGIKWHLFNKSRVDFLQSLRKFHDSSAVIQFNQLIFS